MSQIICWVDEQRIQSVLSVAERLKAASHDVTVCSYEKDNGIIDVEKTELDKFDLLITFDCMGYAVRTLTGGISLNFICSKVMNVVVDKKFKERSFLQNNPISISHFFYFTERTVMDKNLEMYPQIPFAKHMENWSEDTETNGIILYDSICEVLKMCHIN